MPIMLISFVRSIFYNIQPKLFFKMVRRLNMNYPAGNMFKLHDCAVCQLEMKPGEGVSVHGNMQKHSRVDPWGGPFLCSSCQAKQVAMEGKLHLTSMNISNHMIELFLH